MSAGVTHPFQGSEKCLDAVTSFDVADYTGPPHPLGVYTLATTHVDLQTYVLRRHDTIPDRRNISQACDDGSQERVFQLPNSSLKDEWDSLVFEQGLPSLLLRSLTQMIGMMASPGLNLATFNWNRLCLLHGPPGSGKSTLCRALAQKLSIRLGDAFLKATLIEINANALLSKYFGESGKLISATFDRLYTAAQDPSILIIVVVDEIETIAGSRERSTAAGECSDGLRATNQLLTALDRLRHLPNVITLCTSNLIESIDRAFLDRVDIKQFIPSPSPAAIYSIFRSCLNELIRNNLITAPTPSQSPDGPPKCKAARLDKSGKGRTKTPATGPSPGPRTEVATPVPEVPSYSAMLLSADDEPRSAGRRLWTLAQRCEGLSGRKLRRLPVLGLAMYTWGGPTSIDETVSALEAAVYQELQVEKEKEEECKGPGGQFARERMTCQ